MKGTWPLAVMTGSLKTSCVMGQIRSWGVSRMGSDRAEGLEECDRCWSFGLWKVKEDDLSSAELKGLLTDMLPMAVVTGKSCAHLRRSPVSQDCQLNNRAPKHVKEPHDSSVLDAPDNVHQHIPVLLWGCLGMGNQMAKKAVSQFVMCRHACIDEAKVCSTEVCGHGEPHLRLKDNFWMPSMMVGSLQVTPEENARDMPL